MIILRNKEFTEKDERKAQGKAMVDGLRKTLGTCNSKEECQAAVENFKEQAKASGYKVK